MGWQTDRKLEDYEVGEYIWLTDHPDAPDWEQKGQTLIVTQVGGDFRPKNHKDPHSAGEPVENYWVWAALASDPEVTVNGYQSHCFYTREDLDNMYRCSNCGKEGHNRRTCPQIETEPVELSIEEISAVDVITVELTDKAKKSHSHYQDRFAGGKEWEVSRTTHSSVCVFRDRKKGSSGGEYSFDKTYFRYFSVNKEDSESMTIWELTNAVLPHSRLTLLFGPPGTGKTTVANFHGNPNKVCNITLTEETPAAELRGHFVPKGGEFVWFDGPALTAFKKGYRLVLNEIDKASGDALTFCHALLDDPGIARITLPYEEGGEPVTVFPHSDFHVIATMNGEPDDLPDALRDRFAVRIHIDKVNPEAVKALPADLHAIAKKGISGDSSRSVSIRGWNAFAELREKLGDERAAATAVFADRAETILNTIKISRATGGKGTAKKA